MAGSLSITITASIFSAKSATPAFIASPVSSPDTTNVEANDAAALLTGDKNPSYKLIAN